MLFKLKKYNKNISDDDLIADIKAVADQLGKQSLTFAEYSNSKLNKYASNTISRRFKGWHYALEKAGLLVLYIPDISDDELLNDLKRVIQEIEPKKLTQEIYDKKGRFAANTIQHRFGWNNALKKLGFEISNEYNIPEEDLFKNLEEVWIKRGKQPGKRDMIKPISKYSERPYISRFGTWQNALESFVDFINKEEAEFKDTGHEVHQERSNELLAGHLKPHLTKRDINLRLRFLVMRRDNFKCVICGRSPATDPKIILHVDHIKAWEKGGETIFENLQTLCSDDNLGKSNLDMHQD